MNPFTFIKDARLAYLQHLDQGGWEVVVGLSPHVPSGEIAVHDSALGLCPKKAALAAHGIEPTHPGLLAGRSLVQLHRMRNGVNCERDWLATFRFFDRERWAARDGVRLNGPTRGKVDAWLALHSPLVLADQAYRDVLVEVKRTDGNLKPRYLLQLGSYLAKVGDRALGKLVLDHRHTVREYTLVPQPRSAGWQVFGESGEPVSVLERRDLEQMIERHRQWLDLLAESYNARFDLPEGIGSPLDSWECYQDWRKREGKARFRCPYAGYCFGIEAGEFDVHNEKDGRRIAARIVVSDNGREFRREETTE